MSTRHISTHRIVCWQLTRKCNRTCRFCVSYSSPDIAHSTNNPVNIMRRLAQLGVEKISYSGGEPLLHPELGSAVRCGHRLGIDQVVTTNGDLLRKLPSFPSWFGLLQYIKLSFYGDEHLHDAVMGQSHYSGLLSSTRRLTAHGIVVGANYMLTRQSIAAIPQFLSDAREAGVDRVLLLWYMPVGRPVDDGYSLQYTTLDEILDDRMRALSRRLPGGVKVHDYRKEDFFLILDDAGRLTLTRRHGLPSFEMGSVFDDSLALPDRTVPLPTTDALKAVWATRLTTDAIVPIV